jgi:predicted nucleic acid-binding protein
MVLVDTSLRVKPIREGDIVLEGLLDNGHVVCHPFVMEELAWGNLKHRAEILALLQGLPMATLAEHGEVLQFIEDKRPMGEGLGIIDILPLASAVLSGIQLWTIDR